MKKTGAEVVIDLLKSRGLNWSSDTLAEPLCRFMMPCIVPG